MATYDYLDPETGEMVLLPLTQSRVTPAPAMNANSFPYSPSMGINPQSLLSTPDSTGGTPALGIDQNQFDYAKALQDARRAGGMAGIGGMLMGLAQPVKRGQSRLMNSMLMGQKMGQQAEADATNFLATKMKVDEFQKAQDLKNKQLAILSGEVGGAGFTPDPEMMKNVSYLPEANQAYFAESLKNSAISQKFLRANMPEQAKQFADLAKQNREAAFAGQIDPAKRTELELTKNKEFNTTEFEPRYQIVNAFNEMVKQAEAGGGISDYALLIKYIKALDPNSVVREGEVTMTNQFKGFEAQLNEYLKRAKGQGFDADFRNSLLDSAQRQALLAKDEYEKAVERQSGIFSLSGLRPERIITSPTLDLLPWSAGGAGVVDQSRVDNIMSQNLGGSNG